MSMMFTITVSSSNPHGFVLMCAVFAALMLGERQAHAQPRDGLVNGAVIGAAVGAGLGVALTHAVRDDVVGVVVKWKW
jgi:hypothetical protein